MSPLYGNNPLFPLRHNVFVSYHHLIGDQRHRNDFERLFADKHSVMVAKSVQIGDIDPNRRSFTLGKPCAPSHVLKT